jgi:hypothetical protein
MPDLVLVDKFTVAEIGDGGTLVALDEYDAAAGLSLRDHISASVSWDDEGDMFYNGRPVVGRLVAFPMFSVEKSRL